MNNQKREEKIKAIRQETIELQDKLNKERVHIQSDARETVRNMSLVVGGIATGSLVILGSNITTVPIFIMVGFFAMSLEIILIFGYLLHAQNKATENYYAQRKNIILPRGKILVLYKQMKEGGITSEDFDKEFDEIASSDRKYRNEINKKALDENPHTDNWDLIFIGLLGFGFLFVILGICAPFFWPCWSKLYM